MAHLVRTQPDTTWRRGYITVGADLKSIDQKTFVAINGDDGGTWVPAADIIIGGAGVVIASDWVLNGTKCFASGTLTFNSPTGDYFQLGATHPLRSLNLVQGITECHAQNAEQAVLSTAPSNGFLASGILTTRTAGARFLVPVRGFDQASLDSVTLSFYIKESHAAAPQVLPRMRVIRQDANGVIAPLRAGGSASTDADGFQFIASPASGAAYYNSGNVQTFVYTCTQNNILDLSRYAYFVEICDEAVASYWSTTGNLFASLTHALSGITQLTMRN